MKERRFLFRLGRSVLNPYVLIPAGAIGAMEALKLRGSAEFANSVGGLECVTAVGLVFVLALIVGKEFAKPL